MWGKLTTTGNGQIGSDGSATAAEATHSIENQYTYGKITLRYLGGGAESVGGCESKQRGAQAGICSSQTVEGCARS